MELVIATDDPTADDVRALLAVHLRFADEVTPAGHLHALDVDGQLDPAVTFFSARRDGRLLGVGALKRLDGTHGELKSMHTSAAARGQGVGRAMVDHLVAVARALYERAGFVPCPPFGSYTRNPHSTCMTLALG